MKSIFASISLVLILTIIQSACSHGPKLNKESAVESLNGENYQAPIGGDLSFHAGYSRSKISGILLITRDLSVPEPLRFQKMQLMKDNKVVLKAVSDTSGNFLFSGELENGEYVITLDSDQYQVSQSLELVKYKLDGVQVFASKKPKK